MLERKLIRILGKKEIPGRPLIYATTRKFLEIFNLKSLSDMPTLKEIQEFGKTGLTEELSAGLEADQPEQTNESASDQGTGDEEAISAQHIDINTENDDSAPPEAEGGDTVEAADGTFSRQLGIDPPGENETACNGQAEVTVAETDASDFTESIIDTEPSEEPVYDDQHLGSSDEKETVSPEQGLVKDNPENDDTDEEPGEEDDPARY